MYLSWLDIERKISTITKNNTVYPDFITNITCYYDCIDIYIKNQQDEKKVFEFLTNHFNEWYDTEKQSILFDIEDSSIPVEINIFDGNKEKRSFKPRWSNIHYVDTIEELDYPDDSIDYPDTIAFHSFKGGVGRTLHLAAYLFALMDNDQRLGQKKRILVVDADLEAPGITYWLTKETNMLKVSLVRYLEAFHYPVNNDVDIVAAFFAQKLRSTLKKYGENELYILPAFIDNKELMDIKVLPEHLNGWDYSLALKKLGKELQADYILIDLRAGLSEISSPILLDRTVKHFLVTTLSPQSIEGTCLVLQQIAKSNGNENPPNLIISMLTKELKELNYYQKAVTQIGESYTLQNSDTLSDYEANFKIYDSLFHENLLFINSLDSAKQKLTNTTLYELTDEIVKDNITFKYKTLKEANIVEYLEKLSKMCEKYEFAEKGKSDNMLITEFFLQLAQKHLDSLPQVVSLGSKGAGKTFNYLHLARFQFWGRFAHHVGAECIHAIEKASIFPLLQPDNLDDSAKNILMEARGKAGNPDFLYSEVKDRINNKLDKKETSPIEWNKIWLKELALAINIIIDEQDLTVKKLNDSLSKDEAAPDNKVIFIFDGLEELFQDIFTKESHKQALRALLDLPNRFSELRRSNIGIIIFLRKDFLYHALAQNPAQFESKYKNYSITWNRDSFLQLVLWICIESGINFLESKSSLYVLTYEELLETLYKLWGIKLGKNDSKEARTASWVFAALTDFNGKLQARDIVRLLLFSSRIALSKKSDKQAFKRWISTRILPPTAIKNSLEECSQKKVEEVAEEYPFFDNWKEKLESEAIEKRIPFSKNDYYLDSNLLRNLKDIGVIFEDSEENNQLYIPEIYRHGLGFTLERGARPRVIALKRKVMGKGFFT